MSETAASSSKEEEVYVLLDFQGKDMTKLLKQNSVYFRMLNLNESKPIIEVAEDVYEGIYEDVPGTNVFFEEIEDQQPQSNLFQPETPITLKYLLKQSKILKLNHIGVKPQVVITSTPTESVNIDIKDDYRVLLDKYKNGKLVIDDFVVENDFEDEEEEEEEDDDSKADDSESTSQTEEEEELHEEAKEEVPSKPKFVGLPKRTSSVPEWYSPKQQNPKLTDNPTYVKYLKLQRLAEQPVRHKVVTENVMNNEIEQPIQKNPRNNFIVWKNMMMRVVERQSINLVVDKHNINDFVDIDNSITLGIIKPSDITPRIYSKREKQKLLSFKNFINLTPIMKLIILQDCLQYEKSEVENMNEEQVQEKGEDGLSPNERVKLLTEFKNELKLCILNRIKEAHREKDVTSSIDFDINLSEESYEESSTDHYDSGDSDSKSEHMSIDEESKQANEIN